MPKYSEELRQWHTTRIRNILVRYPSATILQIQDTLSKHATEPLSLNKDYINKLVRKIRTEKIHRMDRRMVTHYLAEFEDKVRQIEAECWAILSDAKTEPGDRVKALKEIREANISLFDKMFDSGVFEKKGELVPKDAANGMMNFHLWGQVSPALAEAVKLELEARRQKTDERPKPPTPETTA